MTLNEITTRLGITPNPMQAQTFEFVSEKNENLVILSPTGTGKTLAYLMPVTQKLEETSDDLQAIVVVPGRELALQSATVLKNMGAGLRACACYGGRPTMDEHRVLHQVKPQIVFGTPGRLNDHIDKGNIVTDQIRFIIIDEFDKCLEMGFQNEMVALMQKLPIGARRIFLSATDSEEDSNKLASKTEQRRGELPRELSYKDFSRIDYREKTEAVSDRIKTFSVQSPSKDKLETLERLLMSLGDESSIVFLNYRESVERTASFLREKGFVLSTFHGGLDQRQREDQLFRFSNGSASVMVSTDLGSRGLDIPDISDSKVPMPKMSTLYIGKGKKDKVSKGDVVGFLCKTGDLKSADIGRIDVRDYYTYVAVAREQFKQVIQRTKGQKIKGHKTVIEEIR